MKLEIVAEPQLAAFALNHVAKAERPKTSSEEYRPKVMSVADILALDIPESKMLIEGFLAGKGACLVVGAPKSGKTLLAVQVALAVAGGSPLFDYYRVLEQGPTMLVEQDDPDGAESVSTILKRSRVPTGNLPFYLTPRLPFTFGPEFLEWLEGQIRIRSLRLVALDSYTALRAARSAKGDIVKTEQTELTLLDEVAKRTNSTLLIVHHGSKGAAGMDWTDQAAGTFAMSAATEAQIHISRFKDLDSNSPERLVRIRGRHQKGAEMVLRFREESLDYEHVLEGGAAPDYPVLIQLRTIFGTQAFGPKELSHSSGVSRATASRQIDRLYRANALSRRGYGEYVVV
ncbi:MAG: AAA family ATPase [Bryobacteraceae bacterium]